MSNVNNSNNNNPLDVTYPDEEFERELQQLEDKVKQLGAREKCIAVKWIERLRNIDAAQPEATIRNRFVTFFNESINETQNPFVAQPFSREPDPYRSLGSMEHLLPEDPSTSQEARPIFGHLADGGEFLHGQPVPRQGTFFVLIMRSARSTL